MIQGAYPDQCIQQPHYTYSDLKLIRQLIHLGLPSFYRLPPEVREQIKHVPKEDYVGVVSQLLLNNPDLLRVKQSPRKWSVYQKSVAVAIVVVTAIVSAAVFAGFARIAMLAFT